MSTAIQNRASVLAIKKEVVEGVPVAPAASTDFIALQDDFAMAPAFETLSNAELRASIGTGKPIQGAEAPTASGSHYLRSSGVPGTAPNYGVLLEAAFGDMSVFSTEYDTAASSTTSVVKVGVGEGELFERGQALLIKDPLNGYSVRCIDNISDDDLNLGFHLPVAPGTGVNLGKSVLYKPANTGHPTLTIWHYLGNGGATQTVAGARVTSVSVDINAGQLINVNYSLEALSYYFNTVYVGLDDSYIDFEDDSGTFEAVILPGFYKDPHDLAAAIESAMNATASSIEYAVTYSNLTGKISIVGSGTLFSLLWSSGTNTANTIGDKIGFVTASDDTGATPSTGYISDSPLNYAAPYSPSYDNADPVAAKNNDCMVGKSSEYISFEASSLSVSINTPKTDILSVTAVSGKSGSVINSREVTISISGLLRQYEAERFKNYRENDEIQFQYTFGTKRGGNWEPGKCGAIYAPSCVVSSVSMENSDGLIALSMELSVFVNANGDGEIYFNML